MAPRLMPWAAVTIRLCAAWRNTSVNRTTGTAPEAMMSASTWPGPTEGSWSTSPTISSAASSGTAASSARISITSIGETATALDTRRASVRTGETAFGNLAADAMRIATRSDVALINGGGIRGDTTHPAGAKLTRKLVLTELPFGNRTVKLRLTGAAIRQVLEHGVSRSGRGAGRFPQVDEMTEDELDYVLGMTDDVAKVHRGRRVRR